MYPLIFASSTNSIRWIQAMSIYRIYSGQSPVDKSISVFHYVSFSLSFQPKTFEKTRFVWFSKVHKIRSDQNFGAQKCTAEYWRSWSVGIFNLENNIKNFKEPVFTLKHTTPYFMFEYIYSARSNTKFSIVKSPIQNSR